MSGMAFCGHGIFIARDNNFRTHILDRPLTDTTGRMIEPNQLSQAVLVSPDF